MLRLQPYPSHWRKNVGSWDTIGQVQIPRLKRDFWGFLFRYAWGACCLCMEPQRQHEISPADMELLSGLERVDLRRRHCSPVAPPCPMCAG